MKIFAASAGGLRPKDTRGHFFLPEEGGFGAFSVSSARGFLCGRSALKYKRENRNFLYQTFLFRFLGFCLIPTRFCTYIACSSRGVDIGACYVCFRLPHVLMNPGNCCLLATARLAVHENSNSSAIRASGIQGPDMSEGLAVIAAAGTKGAFFPTPPLQGGLVN